MYAVLYKYGRRKEKIVFESESFEDLQAYIHSLGGAHTMPRSGGTLKSMAHEGHSVRGEPFGLNIKENKHLVGKRRIYEEWVAIWLGPVPKTKRNFQRSIFYESPK